MARGDTKARIIQAAIDLFNEQGTAAVSTNHIAEAAGISPGNLYYHFRNKEQIIRAIFERMNTAWGRVTALPPASASPLTDLRRVLRETFSVLWEYRFFYREFVALMRRDPELDRRYREVRERGLSNTENLLNSFFDRGVLQEPNDPDAVPRLATVLWLITEFWLPFAEMGDQIAGPERFQEGVKLLMQVLKPYMTEEPVAGSGPDRQDVTIQKEKS